MTSLKLKELIFTAIQAQNYPIFDEVELQEDILNAVKEWLKQKRDEYTDNLTYPLGQRVLIGTFFIGLLEDLEK